MDARTASDRGNRWMRWLAGGAAVAALALGGVLAAPGVALADDGVQGVPPTALGACDSATPASSGGWVVRSFSTQGNPASGSDAPFAPKAEVLGEPCRDGSALAIPWTASQIPVDPQDGDACPGGGGGGGGGMSVGLRLPPLDVSCVDPTSGGGIPDDGGVDYDGGDQVCAVTGHCIRVYRTFNYAGFQGWCLATYNGTATHADFSFTFHDGAGANVGGTSDLGFFPSPYCTSPADGQSSYGGIWPSGGDSGKTDWTLYSINAYDGSSYVPHPITAFIPTAPVSLHGGLQGSLGGVGTGADDDAYIKCSDLAVGGTSTTHAMHDFGTNTLPNDIPSGADLDVWSKAYQTDLPSTCAYIVEIGVEVLEYNGDTPVWTLTVWTARSFQAQVPYAGTTPQQQICIRNPNLPVCYAINHPGKIDYSDFAVACPASDWPTPAWLDFSWVTPWIAEAAHCLFFPQGGFDAHGVVAASWGRSAGGQLSDTLSGLTTTFHWSEGCGALIDGNGGPYIGHVVVNTCSWSWGSSVKTLLAIAVLGLFGWWALQFVIRVTLGFINKKAVNPVAEGGASE